jgi:pyrroloquinoline-quinone synthase
MDQSFFEKLDAVIERHSMLNHPFYQSWTEGKLSSEALKEYTKQYNRFVQAFPRYISATHANTPDLATRQVLLENLMEEERGSGNHPGLWAKFAKAQGITAAELSSAPVLPETRETLDMLETVTKTRPFLEGVAALYAYESQIPKVATVKIDGLKKFYNVSDDEGLSFFTVHAVADIYHSNDEREILKQAVSAEEQEACLRAAEVSCKAMLRLLDGVYNNYVVSMN